MSNNNDRSHATLPNEVVKFVCDRINATEISSIITMHSVWGGQGSLLQLMSDSRGHPSSVLKYVRLNRSAEHPRGWNGEMSHQRKAHSYSVERHWYEHYAAACNETCRIPKTLGVQSHGNRSLLLLEDLTLEYPLTCAQLTIPETHVCLEWLAQFHGKHLGDKGHGLWNEGCYWHLATRPDEFEAMEAGRVKDAAFAIDEKLRSARFQTLVHGDAKVANFCFNEDRSKVAAVDFQYVGRGCGMKDVVYFLGSCLTEAQCEQHENQLLDYYFDCLKSAIDLSLSNSDWLALEEEWKYMYPMAWTDFYRFLLGWMPTHAKINRYTLALCDRSLSAL